MKRDFVAELKTTIRKLDRVPQVAEELKPKIQRYNIHKRSLPVGIDKVVVFSVLKAEAEWWIERRLKAKAYHDDPKDSKTIIYYDIIPVDATPRERSVFHNPKDFVKEDGYGLHGTPLQ